MVPEPAAVGVPLNTRVPVFEVEPGRQVSDHGVGRGGVPGGRRHRDGGNGRPRPFRLIGSPVSSAKTGAARGVGLAKRKMKRWPSAIPATKDWRSAGTAKVT